MKEARLKSVIESLILASDKPITVTMITKSLAGAGDDISIDEVRKCVKTLLEEYSRYDRPLGKGFTLVEVANGLQFRTVAENSIYIKELIKAKPIRLTRPSMATLAIIAYKQPCTKSEVDKIRGVDSGGVIASLLEKSLVKIRGKKKEPGHPMIYGTTSEFLELFGLKNLTGLPSLREYAEIQGEEAPEMREEKVRESLSDVIRDLSNDENGEIDDNISKEVLTELDKALKGVKKADKAAKILLDDKKEELDNTNDKNSDENNEKQKKDENENKS